ncbi:hydroxylysine kinase /5-phosphonooxy-L-lysine phospho-lyase [Dongia mobilis]|uniref:Hydroxylysine kinase /5-phosphonooxy-L-lysine phospho-lyase n=1 Tax=Dongia mobilis TaxID=578943 RepID=A0A4R6WTC3_9PROT|nr:aminotransferase class III-fold pyridoxal phosphate-dependent enzyme [Dongia mobilis]TDQ83019.1 hydroxylysine kinase /5-phosphonooxy-L-lysine phospho-lyase [Dongia mobilis]
MSVLHRLPPTLPQPQVAAIVADLYGMKGVLTPLDSERDQNFRLAADDGRQWVVKIANAAEDLAALDFQVKLLDHAASIDADLPLPVLLPTCDGRMLGSCQGPDGAPHFVRVVSYLPGVPFAKGARDEAAIAGLGSMLGRLTLALRGFAHVGAIRDFDWDLVQTGKSRIRLAHVTDPRQREMLEYFLGRFDRIVAPALKRCRAQVIHGDANDYNVLVAAEGSSVLTGLIDFGDAILSPLINEVAVAAAYAAMERPAPIDDIGTLAAAFHAVNPLQPEEVDLLFDLVAARLVISVTMSAARRERAKDNAYLAISEVPAWEMLARLRAMDPVIATAILRQACGFEAAPGARAVIKWLRDNRRSLAPILDKPVARQVKALVPFGDPTHPIAIASARREPLVAEKLWAEIAGDAELGLGPWGEDRPVYTADGFRSKFRPGEWRSLHVGLDFFLPAGSAVRTPLAGRVIDIYVTDLPLDYGHAILLEHEIRPGLAFCSLWGHLSAASAKAVKIGQVLAAGDVVGWMGRHDENGGWQSHVHLQLVTYRPTAAADVIGAGEARYRDVWAELFPSAVDFAGLPPEALTQTGRSRDELLARRKERLIRNLSISYATPLKIVRGEGVHLYDDRGRAYLDCYNNVAQLGHANPEIVEAQARQAATLNTNTRYLHDNIIAYAEALTATLPPHLTVAAFVCSGSEANDLALRMARAHTRRKGIVALDWGYHGHLTSLIEISPYKYKRKGGQGRPATTAEAALPDAYRAPDEWPQHEIGARYAATVASAAARLAGDGFPPAAFIAESLPSSAGQIVLPPGYLPAAYKHAREAGAVVIADEVQIGFGRVGESMWGFEGEGASPDIITMGKPIGNGHPMAALVTTREIAESFHNGMEYFNTFGGNPVSCAIGLKVLEILQRDRLLENAKNLGADLLARMTRLKDRHDIIGDVRGRGLMLGIELVKDRRSKQPATAAAARMVDFCRREGILLGTDGPHDNVIKMRPGMIFTRANADFLMQVLEAGFAQLD